MLRSEIRLSATMYKAIRMPIGLASITLCHMETWTSLTKMHREI
jgi:hypothetical protein